jgi:hypothetical protein
MVGALWCVIYRELSALWINMIKRQIEEVSRKVIPGLAIERNAS